MRNPVVLLLLVLAACQETRPHASASARTVDAAPGAAEAHGDAQRRLDELDRRSTVPLLPMMANHQKQNMRDHLAAVQEIVAGVATSDFEAVERAALRVGSSESMTRMCTHMGAGAAGFTERALAFHDTADAIAVAAKKRDTPAVLHALAETLSACNGCHAAFKQDVVDERTWQRLTSAPAPAGQHSHQEH